MKSESLPVTNESGYYEIRLESIGGLGANLCGKMLGELGLKYLGYNSASFSGYGSEKTGTPVKAYIRYCAPEKEIRVHAPVKNPHLLGIFHEALLSDASVLDGCTKETKLVINTASAPDDASQSRAENVACIDAQRIAMETRSRVNTVMLGAMAKVMGFVPLEDVCRICEDTLGKKYPDSLENNLEGIRRGYREVRWGSGARENQSERPQNEEKQQEGRRFRSRHQTGFPSWGYKTAPIGGINPIHGNTIISDLSPSRQGYYPIFRQERCINCGLCDSTCPDMVFQFKEGIYKGRQMMVNAGLDYYHCKGCLRCAAVCPTQALVRGEEAKHPEKTWFLPNQELLRSPDYYEKTGADGYITSESFLTEKRVEGGEV